MPQSAPRVRIARVVGFGLLAEVATALIILVVLKAHARLATDSDEAFSQRAAAILGPGLGVLFTYLAALRAAGPVPDRARLHGVLVGAVTSLLTLPLMFAGTPGVWPIYAGSIVLKLAAGWAAGAQVEWMRSQA
jgi:hypothetical protein